MMIRKRRNVMSIKVDQNKCTGCGVCAEVCPSGAIIVDEVAKIDAGLCRDCGLCIDECPVEALSMERRGSGSTPRRPATPSSQPAFAHPLNPIPQMQAPVQRTGFQQDSRGDGLLDRVFNFLGSSSNQGRGQGCGRGKGRGTGGGGGRGGGGKRRRS